jgi:hypothetical protein
VPQAQQVFPVLVRVVAQGWFLALVWLAGLVLEPVLLAWPALVLQALVSVQVP